MTTTDLKIADESWTALDEAALDSMSTTAAGVVSTADLYPQLETEAGELTFAANDYHIAHSRYATFGGSDNREAKDAAKGRLYLAHNATARKLEATANGNREYLTRPGYQITEDSDNRRSFAQVPAPVLQKAESVKVRGRVKFILKAANPVEIKAVVGIYSDDDGVTWVEGKIFELGLNFTLEGQPSGKTRLYQFMFKATSGRKSDWSEKIRVEVF